MQNNVIRDAFILYDVLVSNHICIAAANAKIVALLIWRYILPQDYADAKSYGAAIHAP